jgi:hypothetical protein
MTWKAATACAKRTLVAAAFGNFIDTYPLHGGLPLQLISFLPPLRVYVLAYSVHVFYRDLVIACGPRCCACILCLVVWLLRAPCLAPIPCPAVAVLAATLASPTTILY